ncbi:MAG: ubiquinol-cytochrome c reductase iron-sulfur subunit [Alphaproteobacteria bacterium]|nr:ubiquinol-cytochrome c reductase iron-sulfur subunit [Alphaproteobacteria bacterium]
MAEAKSAGAAPGGHDTATRRDFITIAGYGATAVGAAATVWPLIHSMNPSADVRALSATEVDISGIAEGQSITVMWRGKPVFIRHRTKKEIETARADDKAALPHPEDDAKRASKPEILVMMGVCTHLGCVPLGQKGEFGGWFCPCHGSHYDTSGRIRKGPAPKNLEVPKHAYVTDTLIRIG